MEEQFRAGPTRRYVLALLALAPCAPTLLAAEGAKMPQDGVRDLIDAMQAADAAHISATFDENAAQPLVGVAKTRRGVPRLVLVRYQRCGRPRLATRVFRAPEMRSW